MNQPDDDEAHRIRRQQALREWYLAPAKYPRTFEEHIERGDFDHVLKPVMPVQKRGAA